MGIFMEIFLWKPVKITNVNVFYYRNYFYYDQKLHRKSLTFPLCPPQAAGVRGQHEPHRRHLPHAHGVRGEGTTLLLRPLQRGEFIILYLGLTFRRRKMGGGNFSVQTSVNFEISSLLQPLYHAMNCYIVQR